MALMRDSPSHMIERRDKTRSFRHVVERKDKMGIKKKNFDLGLLCYLLLWKEMMVLMTKARDE